jgi:hypothetical protein
MNSSFFFKLVIINNEKEMGGGTQKGVVQYMNCSLRINMQQLEKERQKPQGSTCTSLWKRLKSYKNEQPTPCLQQLEGQKEIPIIQNLIYKSLKKG